MANRSFLRIAVSVFVVSLVMLGCSSKETPKTDTKSDTTAKSADGATTKDSSSGSESSTASSDDTMVKSDSGRFSVKLPPGFPKPTSTDTPVPTAVGTLNMTSLVSQKDEDHVCMVAFADYPKAAIKAMGGNTKKVLDGAQGGAIKKMNATLESSKDIEIDGHPARSFRFSMKTGEKTGYGQFNITLIDERMYQVCYISTEDGMLDKDETVAYFASFKPTE